MSGTAMLIERRRYILQPGGLPAFWQAQEVRGYDTVRPILDRLIGYFSALSDAGDEVVHLYRYDSFDDWKQRLHGLYGVAALAPYFQSVRALMTAQENGFLVPAPVPAASPHWSGTHDWLPSHGPLFALRADGSPPLVEESTRVLRPGTVPAYWAAWQAHAQPALEASAGTRLGTFVSLVGQQHEIVTYRVHAHGDAWQAHHVQLAAHEGWQRFLAAIAPLCASSRRQLLRPAPIPQLSPLFGDAP
ncbi:NIPSNAP family protein [Variovorax boronicumulans]